LVLDCSHLHNQVFVIAYPTLENSRQERISTHFNPRTVTYSSKAANAASRFLRHRREAAIQAGHFESIPF